jgi:arylsulfatase A-like enzyme
MSSNVVLVVMDTARYQAALGEQGPGLGPFDSADPSVTRFDRAYTAAPWTLPSHGSLFTGTYPSRHGGHAGHKRLDETLPTIAEAFTSAGHETVGVSNNTWISEEFGFERGFQTFHRTWQYVQSETDLGPAARTNEGFDKYRAVARALFDGNPLTNVINALYGRFFRKQHDKGAKRTNEWIGDWLVERDDRRPFFLFVNYLEPHLEYRPREKHATRYLPDHVGYEEAISISQDAWGYIAGEVEIADEEFDVLRALYRAEIAYLGDRIAELREMFETAGEWGDTVFVVTGDHGENIGDHGLMDHQYCLYETLLHVPLIIDGGGFEEVDSDRPIQLVDLAPSLLDAAGVEAEAFRESCQGRSFHPSAENTPRERIIAEYLAPQPSMDALRQRVGSLPEHVRRYDRSLRSIQRDGWKLIRGSDGSNELYHIIKDPEETTDHSESNPERVEALASELDEWLDSFEHASVSDDIDVSAETESRLEDLGYLQ